MTHVGGDGAVNLDPMYVDAPAKIIHLALRNKDFMRERGCRNVAKYLTKDILDGIKSR